MARVKINLNQSRIALVPVLLLLGWFCSVSIVMAEHDRRQAASERRGGPCPIPKIELHPLTDAVEAKASPRAGTYEFSESAKLRVQSERGGWRMRMQCTKLKDEKGNVIDPDEVQFVPPGETNSSGSVPLSEPTTVSGPGERGESEVPLALRLVTDARHKPGKYSGDLRVWCEHPGGGRSDPAIIPLTVTVGIEVEHVIGDNELYFHFGGPGEDLSGSIKGYVKADAKMRLTLRATRGRVDRLSMLKPMTTNARENRKPLSLRWRLQEVGGGAMRPPDTVSRDGGQMSWHLHGTPGKVNYALECAAQPDAAQPPGDYGISVEVSLVPVL